MARASGKISETLTHQQKEQQYLEEENHAIRQELRLLLAQTPCANESVPDAVIQLQQNTLTVVKAPENLYQHTYYSPVQHRFLMCKYGDYPDYVARLMLVLEKVIPIKKRQQKYW